MKLYSELLAFLDDHGRSLLDFGSAERGLPLQDARTFLDLLLANGIPLLGIEIWRDTGDRLTIDGLESWYSTSNSLQANHLDAIQYLATAGVGTEDLSAIQFG